MTDKTWPDDIYEHIDNLQKAVGEAKTIEELEAAWEHFNRIEGYVERSWPNDNSIIETCRRLKQGLGYYTRDVREGMPSPYSGWHVELSALRSSVGPKYGADGYPRR